MVTCALATFSVGIVLPRIVLFGKASVSYSMVPECVGKAKPCLALFGDGKAK